MRLPSERGPASVAVGRQQPSPGHYAAAPVPARGAPSPARVRTDPPSGYPGGPEIGDRYDPAMLAYGATRGGNARSDNPYAPKQESPADRSQHGAPPREEVNTGLLLGLDKNSEKALKRAKQEEYKRQLDMQQPKQSAAPPSFQPAAADNNNSGSGGRPYLLAGARPAPERYDPRIPLAAFPAGSGAYPPPSYDSRPPPDVMRNPYEAPVPARHQSNHSNYPSEREPPMPQQARYPPSSYGLNDDGLKAYSGYPGPETGDYSRGAPSGRGGPSPLRQQAPPQEDYSRARGGRQEADPYHPSEHQRPRPQQDNARYGSQAPSIVSSGPPGESDEKRRKREQQEQYRRVLEEQMEIKQAEKLRQKKEQADSDQKFLHQIAATQGDNQKGKKGPGSQQQGGQQPQLGAQPVPYHGAGGGGRGAVEVVERGGAPRGAPAVAAPLVQRPSGGEQYADDDAEEYERLKDRQRAMSNHPGRPEYSGRDDGSSAYSRDDDRGGYGREQQQQGRDPQRDGPLNINVGGSEYGQTNENGSPYKSPNEARTRFMKDIYGGDLITHSTADPQKGGSWRTGAGGSDDRKRAHIAEQKAALDKQINEDRARKEKEKADEKEKDRLKDERDRQERDRFTEGERLEKNKVKTKFLIFL